MVGRRIRDRKVAGSPPPVYALPRNNLGQVVYCRVAVARSGAVVTISAAVPASLTSLL